MARKGSRICVIQVVRQVPVVMTQELVRQVPVPQVQTVERVVQVPQVVTVERIVEVPQCLIKLPRLTYLDSQAWNLDLGWEVFLVHAMSTGDTPDHTFMFGKSN